MMKKPYFIAEVGVNFYDTAKELDITPMEAAKKYIKAAKHSGADAVKFQSYKADTIVSKNSPAYWDTTKEPTATQYELFLKHDNFEKAEYEELAKFANECNIDFMSTPFDYESADFLEPLVPHYKISSSDLTNLPFIRHIAKKGKPIYQSVGAAHLYEVDEALNAALDAGCPEVVLLHCVLSYPCKYEDANLEEIRNLKRIYPQLRIGYSDHTPPDPTMTVLSTAYLFGAEVIEKHFTLNKTLPGNDHYHGGDPEDFAKATENFKLICETTKPSDKRVLDCELTPRREARRSLVLTRDMKSGEEIKETDLMAKRPGTGISPKYTDIVIGRKVNADLAEDTVLTWEMV